MIQPLVLSPHALRRFLDTGKALHVEPMEPQPDWDSTGGCAYPGGRAMGGVYFRSEEEFARCVAQHKELATVVPYRVGDRVKVFIPIAEKQLNLHRIEYATVTDVKVKQVRDLEPDDYWAVRTVEGWTTTYPDHPFDTAWTWLTWLVKPDETTKLKREE